MFLGASFSRESRRLGSHVTFFPSLLGSISHSLFFLAFLHMSYHGPRDNGEGRPGDHRENRNRGMHAASSTATSTRSRPIPASLRSAWGLNNPDQDEEPEVTTPADNPSILILLRRSRSRSPPPREPTDTTTGTEPSRPALFTPGLFGLQPAVEAAAMNMESAIFGALQVAPPHIVRSHIFQILAHHVDRSTISERLASLTSRNHDPIDDV